MALHNLITHSFPDDPAMDAALATAILRRTAKGDLDSTLRVYSPSRTVSFGRLDAVRKQFPDAAKAARSHGFEPVVRSAGGRAAAYHEKSIVVEMFGPDSEGMVGARPRFDAVTARVIALLRGLDVDARLGPVPGEYCPGEWTVNGAGTVKLAGTAQRIVVGGFLFGFELVVDESTCVRAVLADVNDALGIEFDPRTAVSVSDLNPDVTVASVRAAVLHEFGADATVWTPDAALSAEASAVRDTHAVKPFGP